jgi:hypothetical protein
MIKAYQATGAEVTEQAKAWIYSWRSPLRRTLIRPILLKATARSPPMVNTGCDGVHYDFRTIALYEAPS